MLVKLMKMRGIRLKINKDGSTLVKDLVYGDIEFPNKELDDLVILRSDESPTYHFCNVIDDNYQNVSHIIRGEDICLIHLNKYM